MKKIVYIASALLACVVMSCVDDYTDANPPHALDAPTLRLSGEGSNMAFSTVDGTNPYQKTYSAVLSIDGPSEFTVSVIDAPGKIGAVTGAFSVPEFGKVEVDQASANALQGKETGTFKFTFTPNEGFGPEYNDGPANIVITVSDTQLDQKGESAPLTSSLTIPVTLRRCLSTGLAPGNYVVTEASGVLDDGTAYDLSDIEAMTEDGQYAVAVRRNGPGRYTINDITGGVWPVLYYDEDEEVARNQPEVGIDLCGSSLYMHDELTTIAPTADDEVERKFFADLTLNDDGSIDVEWWYEIPGEEDPSDSPAHGTYKMELP